MGRRQPPSPTEQSPEAAWALLGEGYDRKNRGRSVELRHGETVPLIDTVGMDDLACQTTIACEVVPVLPATDGEVPLSVSQTPPIIGLLEWGNDGATVSAEFDFVNGTQLSVAAASVRVGARYDTPPAEPFPVLVRAHIGYMPKPAGPITRTFRAAIDPGAQVVLPVPKFARRVRLVRSPQNAAILSLFQVFPFVQIATVSSAAPELELPIPNDARAVVVDNLGPVAMVTRVIFDLWI